MPTPTPYQRRTSHMHPLQLTNALENTPLSVITSKYDPITPDLIDIEHISSVLSVKSRWYQPSVYYYSIAQHSMNVVRHIHLTASSVDTYSPRLVRRKLWGLLHDASDAYLSHVVRPSRYYATDVANLEDALQGAVIERFFGTSLTDDDKAVVVDANYAVSSREVQLFIPESENIFGCYPSTLPAHFFSPIEATESMSVLYLCMFTALNRQLRHLQ